jgi:hypothetical protein
MREAEEVECFRLSCLPLPALLRSESTKSDQPRFVRVEFQFELGKARALPQESALLPLRIETPLRCHLHSAQG